MSDPEIFPTVVDVLVWLSAGMLGSYIFDKYLKKPFIRTNPVIYHVPYLGPHGEVTLDCIVDCRFGSNLQHARVDKNDARRKERIPLQRVGALIVESGEHGLRMRWQSGEPADDRAPGSASNDPAVERAEDPPRSGGDDGRR